MATGYIPDSGGWSKAGYYTAKLRLYYSTVYNPSNNSSTVTITAQFYSSANYGQTYLIGNFDSNAGIYFNGSKVYTFSDTYGGSSNTLYAPAGSGWRDTDWSRTFTIYHNSNGDASFTAAMECTAGEYYSYSTTRKIRLLGPIGTSTGASSGTIHADKPYSIIYNANGGSGAPSSLSVYSGVSYTLSTSIPTRSGFTFLGWSTNSQATTAQYQPGASITPSGNVYLYAIWAKNNYVLTIVNDGHSVISVKRNGTELPDGSTISQGDVLSINITPNAGYQIESRTPLEDSVTVNGNLTVSAVTSPMATIHIRENNSWSTYLIYIRRSSQWQLHQANIRKNAQWLKYF